MPRLTKICCLMLPLACAIFAPSEPKQNWRDQRPIDYTKIPRPSMPEAVRVRVPVVVRIWEKGCDAGTVGLTKGVRLRILNIDRHGILEVEFAGARCFVDHAATDFVERLK